MEQLKGLVKSLLEKKPSYVEMDSFSPTAYYKSEKVTYNIDLYSNKNTNEFKVSLYITKDDEKYDIFGYDYSCDLTEKEFMELKWQMEAWNKELRQIAFNEFKEFVEQQESPMDELLHDDQ